MENGQNKLVIVSSEVLPDIVLKVLAAKRMRARGEVSTSSEACRKVGISRSAYYKYKDSVFNYEEQLTNNIVSVYCILRDEKGVLSSNYITALRAEHEYSDHKPEYPYRLGGDGDILGKI